jgi:3-hydroxyacyl-[acyl-carrier-protein] dehydratase
MRWFWIDRFVSFESGRRAEAIKTVSLGEEQLNEQIPGYPVMPASLIIEGIAQTGGLLVAEHGGFEHKVVLAKVGKATFHRLALPGDTLTYRAEIQLLRSDGAIVQGSAAVGDQPLADVDLVLAHLDQRFAEVQLYAPADFARFLSVIRMYDVGCGPDGGPLEVPERLRPWLSASAVKPVAGD